MPLRSLARAVVGRRLASTLGSIRFRIGWWLLAYAVGTLCALAGVLMSLYPAATVVLAIVVLRERVTRWQVLGMVLALAAVAMISLHERI